MRLRLHPRTLIDRLEAGLGTGQDHESAFMCMDAGELFFIGYTMVGPNPQLWYAGLDAKGEVMFDHKLKMKHGVMHHDFAVTEEHAIIIDHCLEFNAGVSTTFGHDQFTDQTSSSV